MVEKRSCVLVAVLALAVTGASFGAPAGAAGGPTAAKSGWAILSNARDHTIQTMDMDTMTVYGPFSIGEPGPGEPRVSVVPGGRFALLSDPEAGTIVRIDLLDPEGPLAAGTLRSAVSSLAVSPDGTFAVGTVGTASEMVSIDLRTFSLRATYGLKAGQGGAVAIAPDSRTVVVTDPRNDRIIYGIFDPASGFVSEHSLATGSGPADVAVSPDGRTVLVANAGDNSVNAFVIEGPGDLSAGSDVAGLASPPDTVLFAPDGASAFVHAPGCPDRVYHLRVTGPGRVSLDAGEGTPIEGSRGRAYPGVRQMALSADGETLLAGGGGVGSDVALVSADGSRVTHAPTGATHPLGIAAFSAAYDQSYQDDFGAAQLCLNTTTGDYQFVFLRGSHAGQTFTGRGKYRPPNPWKGVFKTFGSDPNHIRAYNYWWRRAVVFFSSPAQDIDYQFSDSTFYDRKPCQ